MIKRAVPDLGVFLAEAIGLTESTLQSISRRLREAGLLSQKGYGRGAAAATATARDAATLLLVALTELPPLHAVVVARTLTACRPEHSTKKSIAREAARRAKDFAVDDDIPPDPVSFTAAVIERRQKIKLLRIYLRGQVTVGFYGYADANTEASPDIAYSTPVDSPEHEEFCARLGRSTGFTRTHEIDGQVLLDIAEWLMPRDDAA